MSVFIIAEAGINHNGSIDLAYKLVDVAVESGADAVKFQTFKAENVASKNAPKAEYQNQTTDISESQFDMLKKLELDVKAHKELITYCKEKGITNHTPLPSILNNAYYRYHTGHILVYIYIYIYIL